MVDGKTESGEYNAESIQILEGLEAVRKRPAMYIGDTDRKGLHHLIYEIVDNSIDEALGGYAKNVDVVLKADGSALVRDDGRGIPTEKHSMGKSALEVVTTILHAGGKFEKKAYKISGGLHGVGISVVNALSEIMIVEVHRGGKIYVQKYSRGIPTTPVEVIGDTLLRGTTVIFKPDQKIFPSVEFDYDTVMERLRELAFLNKGVHIKINDEKSGKKEDFLFEGGIIQYVEFLDRTKNKLHAPIYFHKEVGNINAEIAIQYTDSYSETIASFVNDIKTMDGGTHVSGFRTGLTRVLNDYGEGSRILKDGRRVSGDDAVEGITAVISIMVPEPQFEGQTKGKLGNSEVKGYIDSFFSSSFKQYLEENPQVAKTILAKCTSAMEAREAAQKAKELIRRKNVFESSVLPGKLADCSEEDPAKCEIFFVEGDSAGGSGKQGRDRRFQAVLPLKGKILNVEKAPQNKILTSNEIRNIVLSLGTGFGSDMDLGKLRYHKIVIMTDADVDGAHIRTLLLTLFFRHFRTLIESGYLYIAQPPLFRVKKGKQERYVYNEDELARVSAEFGGDVEIQRYKGLGEMSAQQLWDTTMNPETRTLKKVTIEDAIKAEEMFSLLMGDAVEPRRAFIEQYAREVKNLDI
ncbi:MAG: DNA topoisomerase (ATP-hydrolyzing) subunit B [Candidatus Micrarchaeia archaeon]